MPTDQAAAVSPFISAEDLAARLEAGGVAVIHVAREPGVAPPTLIPGSIPTAVPTHYADPGDPSRGQLPLPTRDAVRRWAAEAGLDQARGIVVYDDTTGTAAARAWWVLTWAGLPGVRILDGGLRAWTEKTDAAAAPRAEASSALPALFAIDTDAIAAQPADYRLFDARSRAAYDGDGVAPSHLPGALSSPVAVWQDADGRLLSIDRRRAIARTLGLLDENERPVVAYCGSGGAAAYWIAAVQDLGVEASLYAGSWSAWASDPARLAAHRD